MVRILRDEKLRELLEIAWGQGRSAGSGLCGQRFGNPYLKTTGDSDEYGYVCHGHDMEGYA